MRKMLILAAVVFQVLVLGWMAADREWVVRTGRTVWLRTAPVDPNDPFRGDYVRLNYPFNQLSKERFRDGVAAWPKDTDWRHRRRFNDRRVYVTLAPGPGGLMYATGVSDQRPQGTEALWLRGRVEAFDGDSLQVRYGLEAFFVEAGKGLDLERAAGVRGGGGDIQTPLLVEAALRASDGSAVIRQVKPSPLGIGLAQVFDKKDRRLTGVTLKLKNSSDQPLAVVERPAFGAWTLAEAVRPGWGRSTADNGWHWVGRPAGVPPPPVAAREVRVLKPGEMAEYPVDLRDPAWDLVNGKGERKHLTELTDWGHAVRFVYQAPAPAVLQGLPNAALVWQGELPTRAFWARGVD